MQLPGIEHEWVGVVGRRGRRYHRNLDQCDYLLNRLKLWKNLLYTAGGWGPDHGAVKVLTRPKPNSTMLEVERYRLLLL